jgi:hypothetical protein
VKLTVRGSFPYVVFAVKEATGTERSTLMYPVSVTVSLPAALVAVRVTVYVPTLVYVCDGFWEVDELPSPNDQTHEVGEFVEESTNWTVNGAVPEVSVATNDATGVVATLPAVIYPDSEIVLLPAAFVAVSVTV